VPEEVPSLPHEGGLQ